MAEETLQASRILTGNCPLCGQPVCILNNYEVWPLAKCRCGWRGATTKIINRKRTEPLQIAFAADGTQGWEDPVEGHTHAFYPREM